MDIGVSIIVGLLFLGMCILAGFVVSAVLSRRD
jgi:hypothetical protein